MIFTGNVRDTDKEKMKAVVDRFYTAGHRWWKISPTGDCACGGGALGTNHLALKGRVPVAVCNRCLTALMVHINAGTVTV